MFATKKLASGQGGYRLVESSHIVRRGPQRARTMNLRTSRSRSKEITR